jgi:protein TonB
MQPASSSTEKLSGLEALLALEGKAQRGILGAFLVALALHAGAAARAAAIPVEVRAWAREVQGYVHDRLWSEVDLEPPKPPEAPKPDEPEPPKVEEVKLPEPEPPPPAEAPTPAAAPEAAQAGQVLAAQGEPDGPVDLSSAFVQGTGETYAGGTTHKEGTSTTAVTNPNAVPGGVPGGTGTVVAPTQNLSRKAADLGSADWDCPFPSEADLDQIDDAYVSIQYTVTPEGRVADVKVLKDPGHGFGRAAKNCAKNRRYEPALDANGKPTNETKLYNVHFTR